MNITKTNQTTGTALQHGKTALMAPDTTRHLRYSNYPFIMISSQVTYQAFAYQSANLCQH